MCNSFPKEFLSISLEFLKDESWDLLRFILFSIYNDKYSSITSLFSVIGHIFEFILNFTIFSTDPSFNLINHIFWFQNRFSFSQISNKKFITLNINDRWSCSISLCICDYLRFITKHVWNTRVGRSKVNSNNFCHLCILIINKSLNIFRYYATKLSFLIFSPLS